MTKTTYFRACKNRDGYTFQACEGYLQTVSDGKITISLVFGKNQYNRWTITELTTGMLVKSESFETRRAAFESLTDAYVKKIIECVTNPYTKQAIDRLQAFRETFQV